MYETWLIIPRTAGVSINSTVWCIWRRPRPRKVALCFGKRAIELRTCVTLIVLAIIHYPKISSTVLPRFAATISGDFIFANASIVARTTLIGLVAPYALERTLRTPATSHTARIAPPAIIPVPSLAGCINTREPV